MSEEKGFRPMRRFKQQLSQEECESILAKVYRGFLSVNGEMGYPYTVPMNFVYENGHIYFHSALEGHKIDAIRLSPNACFTVIDEPVKEENDWWFHVKNQPGSHVVLQCKDGEEEPTETAFTEAAMIAAYNSKARGGVMIPVDYMKVSKVKKPAGAKPGLVVYQTNWTAYVTPDEERIQKMKRKN